eukprot:7382045-Prymnesium_polylepis.1
MVVEKTSDHQEMQRLKAENGGLRAGIQTRPGDQPDPRSQTGGNMVQICVQIDPSSSVYQELETLRVECKQQQEAVELLQARLRGLRKSALVEENEAMQLRARLGSLRKSMTETPAAPQGDETSKLHEEIEHLQIRLHGLRRSLTVESEQPSQDVQDRPQAAPPVASAEDEMQRLRQENDTLRLQIMASTTPQATRVSLMRPTLPPAPISKETEVVRNLHKHRESLVAERLHQFDMLWLIQ